MFRCQYSNEVSAPAQYQTREIAGKLVKTLVTPAECPVTVVLTTRQKTYTNYLRSEGRRGEGSYVDQNKTFNTYGTEIVSEIKVRPKYEQEVLDLVANGQLDKLKKAFRRK